MHKGNQRAEHRCGEEAEMASDNIHPAEERLQWGTWQRAGTVLKGGVMKQNQEKAVATHPILC